MIYSAPKPSIYLCSILGFALSDKKKKTLPGLCRRQRGSNCIARPASGGQIKMRKAKIILSCLAPGLQGKKRKSQIKGVDVHRDGFGRGCAAAGHSVIHVRETIFWLSWRAQAGYLGYL